MAKQRKDAARGATYGAGVALVTYTFQVPPFIQEIEQKKKKDLNILCTLPGCFTEKNTKPVDPNSANIGVILMMML